MTLTLQEVEKYLQKYRKRGERTVSLLGKYKELIDAVNTDFGKQFLYDIITEHELLLEKVASIEATPEEISEYKATRKILLKYSAKISAYYEGMELIKQSIMKGETK